jgi:hypothetical protein
MRDAEVLSPWNRIALPGLVRQLALRATLEFLRLDNQTA